jgi:actin-related protein 8
MSSLLLNTLGFKQLAVQQEAYCAIFGAGMPSACVVDIGAELTSVTCVDEGQVVADSRHPLAYGGDDITAILTQILKTSAFPYNVNLSSQQDWMLMDELKIRMCTLIEVSDDTEAS